MALANLSARLRFSRSAKRKSDTSASTPAAAVLVVRLPVPEALHYVFLPTASPAYLERHGLPQSPDDLHNHLAVNYASPSSGRVEAWEWVEGGVLRSMPMRGRVAVNSAEAYIACCLAGLGLIQIPAYDVRHHLGELVEVMLSDRAEPMPMTLLYPHRQHLSRRLHVFADWLEGLLKREVL